MKQIPTNVPDSLQNSRKKTPVNFSPVIGQSLLGFCIHSQLMLFEAHFKYIQQEQTSKTNNAVVVAQVIFLVLTAYSYRI